MGESEGESDGEPSDAESEGGVITLDDDEDGDCCRRVGRGLPVDLLLAATGTGLLIGEAGLIRSMAAFRPLLLLDRSAEVEGKVNRCCDRVGEATPPTLDLPERVPLCLLRSNAPSGMRLPSPSAFSASDLSDQNLRCFPPRSSTIDWLDLDVRKPRCGGWCSSPPRPLRFTRFIRELRMAGAERGFTGEHVEDVVLGRNVPSSWLVLSEALGLPLPLVPTKLLVFFCIELMEAVLAVNGGCDGFLHSTDPTALRFPVSCFPFWPCASC